LRLPAHLPEVTEIKVQNHTCSPADDGPRLRVLVAEDNPANQRIIEQFLRPINVELTMVSDGLQAVEALATTPFDVVLMDMQMPVMDGLEATRQVRASGGPNANVPILALTANVMDLHREACEAAGMSGHIGKPIDARLLISSVLNAGLPEARAKERPAA
jgi:CheY-like chemotaxis protein